MEQDANTVEDGTAVAEVEAAEPVEVLAAGEGYSPDVLDAFHG